MVADDFMPTTVGEWLLWCDEQIATMQSDLAMLHRLRARYASQMPDSPIDLDEQIPCDEIGYRVDGELPSHAPGVTPRTGKGGGGSD